MERSLWKREERSVIDRHMDHLTDRETRHMSSCLPECICGGWFTCG